MSEQKYIGRDDSYKLAPEPITFKARLWEEIDGYAYMVEDRIDELFERIKLLAEVTADLADVMTDEQKEKFATMKGWEKPYVAGEELL